MSTRDVRDQFETEGGQRRPAKRNRGLPLDLDWIDSTHVDGGEVDQHCAALAARRAARNGSRAARQLRAITCIDLTTLSDDDTPDRVRRLCAKAREPVRREVLDGLGVTELDIHVAAVCVYSRFIETALEALDGSGIPVCTVSAGFPTGRGTLEERVREIRASRDAGAEEIDVVINCAHVLDGSWRRLYDDVCAFRQACGPAHMKVILRTGELRTLGNVAQASLVAMMAGADFIKTSTGKERINATLPAGLAMVRSIRAYRDRTGDEIGFKPAGGISNAGQAADWMTMVEAELGERWLSPALFRIGASSLLGDLELQLEQGLAGR